MDMGNLMKMMAAWSTFTKNHPKFPAFCKAVAKAGIKEDTIIEVIVTTPDAERIETSLRVQASDIELLNSLSQMTRQ